MKFQISVLSLPNQLIGYIPMHELYKIYIFLTCEDAQVLDSIRCSTVSQIPDLHIGDLGGLP
jgi:hypothetical protein